MPGTSNNLNARQAALHEAELVQRGIRLHNARAFLEAERCYQAVLQRNPKNTDALNLMGVLAVEANRNDLALGYFRKAVQLAPNIAMYQNNLGNALVVNSDLAEALPHLLKAANLQPDYQDALCNLGKVYRLMGDKENASRWFNRALSVAPGLLQAKAGLAEIASELGNFEEATAAFEAILAEDPLNVEALCGLALARKFEDGDPWVEKFETAIRSGQLRPDQLAPLHHSFAKVCNDLRRYDEAFQHFKIGKALKKASFDGDKLERSYQMLSDLFTPEFFAERHSWGMDDERPVFVVGLPRSGTTLTEQILASHRQIAGLGELPDMRKVAQSLGYGSGDPEDFIRALRKLTKADIRPLAERYLKAYAQNQKPGVLRLVDKSPHNYELLGLIALLFPKAHVLFCKRDPLDNCVAIFMQNFNDSHGYNRSLEDLGRYWRAYKGLTDKLLAQIPLALTVVQYEDTVSDAETSVRKIVAGSGLDWDEACARFHETERQVRTPSRWQVRQPIYSTSVERWRRYEKHLGPLKQALGLTPSESH